MNLYADRLRRPRPRLGRRASSARSWRAHDGGRTWKQQHAPVESTLFGVRLRRRAARLGGRASTPSSCAPTDGGATWATGTRTGHAALAATTSSCAGSTGWIVGDSGHGAEERRRRRHLARSSRCPIELAANWIRSRLARARRARARRRRRGSRLPRRRRHPRATRRSADTTRTSVMIPKRWVEAYLRFLLRNRLAVSVVDRAHDRVLRVRRCTHDQGAAAVPRLLSRARSKISVFGQEITLREGHPYIKIYNEFRRMFGSANVLTVILEMKHGDIYNPTTLQKIDQITKRIVETKGVVPYQILSIAHPKMKSITTCGGAIQIREVFYPGRPADAGGRRARQVRGLLHQGHPRPLRLRGRHRGARARRLLGGGARLQLPLRPDDGAEGATSRTTTTPSTSPASRGSTRRCSATCPRSREVFVVTIAALTLPPLELLPDLDRRLGADLLGPPLEHLGARHGAAARPEPRPAGAGRPDLPLGARAVALGAVDGPLPRGVPPPHDKHTAIVESYSHLFPPAIASVLSDGIGILLVAIAPIPLIQKVRACSRASGSSRSSSASSRCTRSSCR